MEPRWIQAVQRIQAHSEHAGYVCVDLLLRLIRWAMNLIKQLRAPREPEEGEGYLGGFPKR